MKIKNLAALIALCGTVSAQGPQGFFLPIGDNFYHHIKTITVDISIASDEKVDSMAVAGGVVDVAYHPKLGTPQAVAEKYLADIATRFVPPPGKEDLKYQLFIAAYANLGPYYEPMLDWGVMFQPLKTFRLVRDETGKWRLPESVLKVRLDTSPFPFYIPFYLPWVKAINFVLRDKSENEVWKRIILKDNSGIVRIPTSYVVSDWFASLVIVDGELKSSTAPGTIVFGEMTLHGRENRWVKVDLKNGAKTAESNPPPYPTKVVPPAISKIDRQGKTTILTVAGLVGDMAAVDFSSQFTSWSPVVSYPLLTYQPITLTNANTRITLPSYLNNPSGFYRLRSAGYNVKNP